MKLSKSTFSVGVVALTLLASGCSTSNLRSDYDRSADFGQYKTYNFYENAGPGGSEYQGFFSQYMIEAIEIEMEKRGYVKADDPDIWVNFNEDPDRRRGRRSASSTSVRYRR